VDKDFAEAGREFEGALQGVSHFGGVFANRFVCQGSRQFFWHVPGHKSAKSEGHVTLVVYRFSRRSERKVQVALHLVLVLEEIIKLDEHLKEGVPLLWLPGGGWEEVEEVDEVVVEMDPEILCRQSRLKIVDDSVKMHLFNLRQFQRAEFFQSIYEAHADESQEGWKSRYMQPLKWRQQALELRNLLSSDGEDVCANAQNRMEEEDAR